MERINKLEAAKRQLKEAVLLFFERRDGVAIHTLIGAAHEICYDLAKAKGVPSLLRDNPHIRPEKRGEFNRLLSKAKSFFKHADRHPEVALDFDSSINELLLLDAICLYQQLTGELCHEFTVFVTWLATKDPELLMEGEFKETLEALPEEFKRSVDDFDLMLALLRKEV